MKRFALIMIDMQRGFLDPASPLCIPSAAATVPACAAAMDACRRAGTPVVYATRHYRADGSDVEPLPPGGVVCRADGHSLKSARRRCPTRFRRSSPLKRATTVSSSPGFSAFFSTQARPVAAPSGR